VRELAVQRAPARDLGAQFGLGAHLVAGVGPVAARRLLRPRPVSHAPSSVERAVGREGLVGGRRASEQRER